ncbi:MAG TPA: redoxin domain-containing protein [Symbiobacteriaceae bacterium]|nr:redoxin domain-containing protein [Symbiobacteriaceae bacterium]
MPRTRFCHRCGWDSKLAAAGKAASTAGQRPAWKRLIMAVILGMSSVAVLALLLVPRGDASANLVAGEAAPDFALQALDGTQVRLADLKGKPVVINFWASWCSPCRKEMPDFEVMYQQYREQGLVVLGINVGEPRVTVADFRQQVGVTFPILTDVHEDAQSAYKILPLPATFFVDRSGTIRSIYQYQMSRSQMETEVLRLLGN